MNYMVYKLLFQTAVHFGKNSLESSEYTFCADTLFSALYIEALKSSKEKAEILLSAMKHGEMCISDAFPYMNNRYFLPKPMIKIVSEQNVGNSMIKKAYKKLKFIPAESMQQYLKGEYDVENAPKMDDLGSSVMKVSASIRGEEETQPYRIGTYYFKDGNGLYIIVGYEEKRHLELLDELMERLSYSGIGGERTSGLGRFQCEKEEVPAEIEKRLHTSGKRYMLLSMALPQEQEMAETLQEADYLLVKRSGFVTSETYANSQMRKKDLYVFKVGSCFGRTFAGDVYDVSNGMGRHPVYRYAKPMFLEVSL